MERTVPIKNHFILFTITSQVTSHKRFVFTQVGTNPIPYIPRYYKSAKKTREGREKKGGKKTGNDYPVLIVLFAHHRDLLSGCDVTRMTSRGRKKDFNCLPLSGGPWLLCCEELGPRLPGKERDTSIWVCTHGFT